MTKYAFLSDEWVGEAKRIYAEGGAGEVAGGADLAPVRVNLVVTEVPFSESPGRCPRRYLGWALRH